MKLAKKIKIKNADVSVDIRVFDQGAHFTYSLDIRSPQENTIIHPDGPLVEPHPSEQVALHVAVGHARSRLKGMKKFTPTKKAAASIDQLLKKLDKENSRGLF